jgi:hypothetical protein
MLEHLAAVARSSGIERFDAETLPDNRAMMDVSDTPDSTSPVTSTAG